jgi:hypothetical protein
MKEKLPVAKELVDSLFEGYEQTAELADFKEELLSNLNDKLESLVKKGMDSETAFAKASAELGDISALADELSLKKRKEVFEEVYIYGYKEVYECETCSGLCDFWRFGPFWNNNGVYRSFCPELVRYEYERDRLVRGNAAVPPGRYGGFYFSGSYPGNRLNLSAEQ